ncbi:MAG: L-lactate permease [Breznakia sp.]
MLTLFTNFILALSPILWLIFALTKLNLPGYKVAFISLCIAFVNAIVIWHMSAWLAASAALEGIVMAIWPISLVIVAAVFTYNLTVYSGAMEVIKSLITSLSNDQRVLVILIGWCFGGFLEGMAGFGSAVAIPASMLYALGFSPVKSILVCLVANGMPTMFGSIGIPTVTLSNILTLDPQMLGFVQVLQAFPLLFISPFMMVIIIGDGLKSLKGHLSFLTISALSFILPELLIARFVGAELAVVVGSVASMVCCLLYVKYHRQQTPKQYYIYVESLQENITLKKALIAFSPFILIFIVLLSVSKLVPFIYNPLMQIQSSLFIYQGENVTPYSIVWLATPGTLILLSAILSAFIQKIHYRSVIRVFINTFMQMKNTIMTMIAVLATSKIMGYSGMTSSIANFLVSVLGNFYPFAAPLVGALGTFVTGSGTSSGVLFGNVQLDAAQAIHVNPYWLAAANSLGTGAGKMLSPQTIAIGCAATSLVGKDGEILKKIAPYALGYLILMSFIVYFGQGLWTLLA